MKLILTQEVTGLGAPGDVVEVKDGYGRNYLVPRGLATRWTRGAERQVASLRKAREASEVRDEVAANQIKRELEELTVRVPARAGETGRLFGAITVSEIADAVRAAGGPEVEKRRIEILAPIKSLGEHEVSLRLHPEVTAGIQLEVVRVTS